MATHAMTLTTRRRVRRRSARHTKHRLLQMLLDLHQLWLAVWESKTTPAPRGKHERPATPTAPGPALADEHRLAEHRGADEEYAEELHGWNHPDEQPTDVIQFTPAQHELLLVTAPVICGTGLDQIDGHALAGNFYDQLPGL